MEPAEPSRPSDRTLEDQLNLVFHSSHAGIMVVDPGGRITFANGRMARLLGTTLDGLLKLRYQDHIHPDQRAHSGDLFRRLVNGELESISVDRCMVRADGTTCWTLANVRRHAGPDGRTDALVAVVTDISDLKATEDSLRASEAQFRSFVESSFDVIFVLDQRGVFQFVSPAWEEHFGHPVREAAGQDFRPFVHPDDALACGTYLQEVLTQGRVGQSPPYRVRHRDGSWRLFMANGRTFQDARGRLLYIGVGRDITAQHALEQERERLIAELQAALQDVKALKGILPICASCKKIRDDQGYWNQVESYLAQHTKAEFTHGLCPGCLSTFYEDLPPRRGGVEG